MVNTRETPTPANMPTNRIGEGEYADEVAAHVSALWNVSILTLIGVSGINDIVASVSPPLTAYAGGMAFWFTPVNDNTDAMSLDINDAGALDILHQDGSPIAEGDLVAGTTYLLLCTGTEFRVQNHSAGASDEGGAGGVTAEVFTTSDVWGKPSTGTVALVRVWAAGGGGARGANNTRAGGGGGGGGYNWGLFYLANLASTVSVTVGVGGAGGTASDQDGASGGNSSFGAHVSAFGGGGGDNAGQAGGGGGAHTAGALGSAGGAGGLPQGNGAAFGGGAGGASNVAGTASAFGGAGGGGGAGSAVGGNSVYGGAGGGGGSLTSASAGGTSSFGGNGGAGSTDTTPATSGSAPGGGGGGSENAVAGSGADGRVEVIVW